MLKKLSLLLIPLLIIALFTITACDGDDDEKDNNGAKSSTSNLIDVVPQRSNMLAQIDLAKLLDQDYIDAIIDAASEEDIESEEILDEAMNLITELEKAVVFADVADLINENDLSGESDLSDMDEVDGYLGIIASGNFNEDALVALLKDRVEEPLTTITYEGYTIHSDEAGDVGIIFLDDDQLAIGSIQAIKDIIDIREGTASPLSGELLDTYNDLGSAMMKMVMIIPADMMDTEETDSLTSELPLDVSFMEDMTMITLTLDQKSDLFTVFVELCFDNLESAESVMAIFDMLPMLSGMITETPTDGLDIQALVDGIDANLDGSCVKIDIELPTTIIEDLTESLDSSDVPL